MPAVEVLLNTKLVSELIEKGDFTGVKEAMEKSLAEGSQTFEQDLARLINDGTITRDEGLAYADSPTNLMWRLQNDMAPVSRIAPKKRRAGRPADLHRDHARRAARAPRSRRVAASAAPVLSDRCPPMSRTLRLAEAADRAPLGHARRRRLPGADRRAAARRSASTASTARRPGRRAA